MKDIKEAAKLLNLTPQQVRNLCRYSKLDAEKIGNTWVIQDDVLKKYYDKNSCGIAEDRINYKAPRDTKQKPIVLSFFSGAMGLDIGLENVGFEVLLCCENDTACRKTIIKNKPDIGLIGDIRNYTASDIRKAAKIDNETDIDLIIGGPPCQAFSTAGKRKAFEDERGNVFLTFLQRIKELGPKYAVIENVRGILSAPLKHRPHSERGGHFPPLSLKEQKGSALHHVLKFLRNAGYGVSFNLYNSANFGTPQKRERVVIVCSRDGHKPSYLVPTHSENEEFGLLRWKTFREAVQGLPKTGHHHIDFPEKRLKFYRLLKPGQYWRHLPKELQKEALGKSFYSGGGKTGFLRRIAWDEPSPTLVTHPAMPATDLAHPEENRPLSIEEYKRIQEFPDSWEIEGSMIEQYRQIGNAVPIKLGEAIGKLIYWQIKKRTIRQIPHFKYSRYLNTDDESWENEFLLRRDNETKLLKLYGT